MRNPEENIVVDKLFDCVSNIKQFNINADLFNYNCLKHAFSKDSIFFVAKM